MPTADIVIIGGGIVGASIAYHLTEAGCGDVLILERECVQGFGSTGRATGGVRAQFSTPVDIQLSLHSIECFRTFEDATGVNPGYRPNGYLFLATTPGHLDALLPLVRLQQQEGVKEVRLLARDEVRDLVPFVFTDDVLGGSFCPSDGFIEPLNLLQGYMRRALDRGARVLLETEVTALDMANASVRGVVTNRGTIATRCVVNAAGAWAKKIAAMAGIALPVEPLRRHVAGTQPLADVPDGAPMVVELGTSFHFRKDHTGGGGVMLLWNDPAEPVGEATEFDKAWLRTMLPMAWRRLPCCNAVPVSPRRCWTGLYEMTPDHHPILGKVPGVDGLYLANGFSGHGVMHSPATGQLLAELILSGKTRSLDITPLGIERFAQGKLLNETGVL